MMSADDDQSASETLQPDVAEAEADKAGGVRTKSHRKAKSQDTTEAKSQDTTEAKSQDTTEAKSQDTTEAKSQDTTEAKRPPRFVYNCVRCGRYCEKVEGVPVTLEDLRRWTELQMMGSIMPHLELLTDGGGNPRLVLAPRGGLGDGADPFGLGDLANMQQKGDGLLSRLRKKKKDAGDSEDGPGTDVKDETEEKETGDGEATMGSTINIDGDGTIDVGAAPSDGSGDGPAKIGCPFHDKENQLCQIYHALPTSCAAYPLGYNGSKYFVVDKSCSGLGSGKMSVEALKTIRDAAAGDFAARTETGQLLTTLYGLFMGQMAAQSARMMGKLDPEKLKHLSELLGNQPPEGSF